MAMETETARAGWRARAAGLGRGAAGTVLGIIYPPTCIGCGGATGEAHTLCARCWSDIQFIERPYCERLGTPFAVDLGMALLSPAAIADPPVFERARAAARYDDVARKLVHRLKYGERLELGRALGAMMVRSGAELLADAEIVVPVPLHRWRLWWRRFNQAMALASVIAKRLRPALRALAPRPRQGDEAPGRALESPARREPAGRLPRAGGGKAPARRQACPPRRRRDDDRGDRERRLARAPARRRQGRRRARLRPGGPGRLKRVATPADRFHIAAATGAERW